VSREKKGGRKKSQASGSTPRNDNLKDMREDLTHTLEAKTNRTGVDPKWVCGNDFQKGEQNHRPAVG